MTAALKGASSLTPPPTSDGDPLKGDFRLFLYLVWKHLGLPDPTPVQYDIAHFLQHGPKRLMVMAFRGLGKSWITSAFVLWLLYCNPQLNILVVSASKARSDDFSTFTMRLISEMEVLEHLQPRDSQRHSKIAFDVGPANAAHAASVKSAGITGQITGSRADVIVADDIEVPNNSETEQARIKLGEAVKEFDSILKPLETARIIFLGTPQSEQSTYNGLPERGFTVRIWPARYPSQRLRASYGPRMAPKVGTALDKRPELATRYGPSRGAPTDPKRFSNEDLMEREASIGRSTFALQFMLDTTLADADRYPLKLADLVVLDLDRKKAPVGFAWGSSDELIIQDIPNVGFNGDRLHKPFNIEKEWAPYQSIVMAIDPAGRGKDEVGYAIVGYLYGFLHVLDCGGLRGGYAPENLEKLANLAKDYGVKKIMAEPNMGDGMFSALLRPVLGAIYPCSVEETERSNAQKEARIVDALEPVMNQHRLVVDKALFKKDADSTGHLPPEQQSVYRLFHQMTRITRDRGSLRHDDRLDALALAVHYFREQMARDSRKAAQDHRDRQMDLEVKQHLKDLKALRTGPSGRPASHSRGLGGLRNAPSRPRLEARR